MSATQARPFRSPRFAGGLSLLLLTAALTLPIGAQAPAPVTWEAAMDAYLDKRPTDAALVLRLPPAELATEASEAMRRWAARARAADAGPRAAEARRLAVRRLQASALVPLEVIVPLSGRTVVRDEVQRLEDVATQAWLHLDELDALLVDTLDAGDRQRREATRAGLVRFRARWQVAWLQFQVNAGRLTAARTFATQIRLPRDDTRAAAEVQFLRGLMDEVEARMAAAGMAGRPSTAAGLDSRTRVTLERLGDAARWYRRTLGAAQDHQEARLHLGRVELERTRPQSALETLAPLCTPQCAAASCGLAWLFTGEAHEAAGRRDDAAVAYSRASSALAVRQSALLALIQLSLRRGNTPQAFELTSQFSGSSPLARLDQPDAWSTYLTGRRGNAEAVLALAREALLQ